MILLFDVSVRVWTGVALKLRACVRCTRLPAAATNAAATARPSFIQGNFYLSWTLSAVDTHARSEDQKET